MRIGEITEATGVSPRSIRYYEKFGLIKPKRMSNGYRCYSKEDVKIVRKIQLFIAAGISLKNIKYIVPCTLQAERILMCKELESMFFKEVAKIEGKIKSLHKSKKTLLEIIKNREVVED